jgi:hypothetical protein
MKLRGEFYAVLRGGGKPCSHEQLRNNVCLPGVDDMLTKYFKDGVSSPAWYLGLISNSGFTGVSADDTMSSHSGWTELTAYSQSTRPQWNPASAGGGIILSAAGGAFTFTSNAVIVGVFLVSNSTKGGTSGVLWSTALYATPRSVIAGQTLTLNYRCSVSIGSDVVS